MGIASRAVAGVTFTWSSESYLPDDKAEDGELTYFATMLGLPAGTARGSVTLAATRERQAAARREPARSPKDLTTAPSQQPPRSEPGERQRHQQRPAHERDDHARHGPAVRRPAAGCRAE